MDELRVLVFDSSGKALHHPVIVRASSIKRLLVGLENAERRGQVCLQRFCIYVQQVFDS